MSASEFDAILRRLADLERHAALQIRSGVVTDRDVEKGYRVQWNDTGFKSPWIKQSSHHGIVVEHIPFRVGQTVVSKGMDPEGLTAIFHPHSESENNPADGDKSLTAHTYRIRKEPEDGEAAKDDKDDVRFSRDYNKFHINVGEKLSRKTSRETKSIVDTVGKEADSSSHFSKIDQDSGITKSVSGGKHKITIHPAAGINHSAENGDHTIKLDSSGITESTKKVHSRSANQQITDTSPQINHNGSTNVSGTLNVSQLLTAAGGLLADGSLSSTGGMSSAGDMSSGGNVKAAGRLEIGAPEGPRFYPGPYTVASLPPSPPQGSRSFVTDAVSPSFLGVLTGGGAVTCPAFYNGISWVSA